MADTETVVNQYIEMWNETEEQQRRELVARTVTEDSSWSRSPPKVHSASNSAEIASLDVLCTV